MVTQIILDTDIGTDIDDCLALALILGSPELHLEGVTCVYGDVDLRARIALKLLKLRGVTDTPVMAGISRSLMGIRPIYWEGHEGKGLLEPDDDLSPGSEFAPDYIVRRVMDNPGQIHVIGIGPLTNLAAAFLKEPRLAQNVAHVTIMGCVARGLERLDLPFAEHNIVCDPEAAHIVFSSGAPVTIIPLDITTQVQINRDGLERIRRRGTPYHRALSQQLEDYPPFKARGWTHMHDPLAVAAVIDPSLVGAMEVEVEVETGGRLAPGATLFRKPKNDTGVNIRLVNRVDIQRFESFLIDRLER